MIISWKLTLFFLSVLIFILTFPMIGLPIKTGLDESFYFANNYLFHGHYQYGTDVIFPYGPLGFLLTPQNIGNNLLFSVVLISILRLSLIYLSFRLFFYGKNIDFKEIDNYSSSDPAKGEGIEKYNYNVISSRLRFRYARTVRFIRCHSGVLLRYALASLIIFFFANTFDDTIFGLGALFIFNIALLLLFHFRSNKRKYLIFSANLLAITLFTQVSYFLNAISLIAGFITVSFFIKRSKRLISDFFLIITTFIITAISIWLVLYAKLEGIVTYLRGLYEISSGFNSSMTISVNNNWLLLWACLLLLLSAYIFSKDKNIKTLFLIFLFPLYLSFRYSFGRQDIPHEHFFSDYLVLFYFLILIFSRKFLFKISLIMFLSILIYGLHMQYLPQKKDPGFIKYTFKRTLRTDGVKNFNNIMLNFARFKKDLDRESEQNLTEKKLSVEISDIIGKDSIDIYPWEISIVAANNLNWRSRPVFQSYVAFTPWLDNKNYQFINSMRAPEFILLDGNHAGGEAESIDGRFLLSDEPKTWATIVRNYSVVREEDNSILLRRKKTVAFHQTVNMEATYSQWNKWIQVPKMNGGILRAEISFRRNIFGKLKKLFWKESETFIEYEIDGEIERYRLVLENASSGIWIEPFMKRLSPFLSGNKVTKIRIIHQDVSSFDSLIKIEWIMENYPVDT